MLKIALERWDAMSEDEQKALTARVEASKLAEQKAHEERMEIVRRRGYTSLSDDEQEKYQFHKLMIIEQNAEILKAVSEWDPSKTTKGIFLFGTVGTGKSALCKCMITKWAKPKYRCKFMSAGMIMETIKSAIDTPGTSVETRVNEFIGYNLLVIDDLGVEKESEWAYEKLFSIIDTRINLGKHTFYTTNYSLPKFIERYGPRVADRIKSSCRSFPMVGKSFREILNNNDEW